MPRFPPGLKLTGTPSSPRGRGLKAARPFAPGEAVAVFTTPSIAIPDSPSLYQVCNYCLSPDVPVRACTGCRTVMYCSAPCQKADWSLVHKQECKVCKRVRAEGHDFLPTPVRALVHWLLREDMIAAAAEMEGHIEEFRGQTKEWADMELQAMAALHYLGREANPRSVGIAMEMLCRLQVNSFNRLDEDVGQTGMFVNPALAMVNHSCVPNAFIQFVGRKAVLRAYPAVKEGEELEISYIDFNLHRSHRQQALKERWHFICICPRCTDDLDVYHVCQLYPHLVLNSFSLNSDLDIFRDAPVQQSSQANESLQRLVEKIHPICSKPLIDPGVSEGSVQVLRKRWHMCEPLRIAKLYAIEPFPRVMGQASIYFGERNNFPYSLAICCFLALRSDPIKSPMPFSAVRIKGLLMIANLLSNTAPISGATLPTSGASVSARLTQALSKMDQATMTQAILAIAVRWATMAHSDEWQVCQEAKSQLKDLENLPGRDKEKALIRAWARNQGASEGKLFFEYAVLSPIRELAEFALEVMDTEFGS
ncbi:hypothetical protein BJ170DRAFT_24106 [Xylariales sp. AK1849]|nr:hypothetical protein BJ170DRAFT_24106 [Xylariales sp. AK1849]